MQHFDNNTTTLHEVFSSLSTHYDNSTEVYPGIVTERNRRSWDGHETELLILHVLAGMLLIHIPFIIITNTVVIVAFVYFHRLHTPGNVILTGLAITDITNGLVNIPILVINNFDFTLFKTTKFLCFLRYLPMLLTSGFSLSMLVVLAVDRYLALSRPFWYISHVSNTTVLRTMYCLVGFYIIIGTIYAATFHYDEDIDDVLERCTYKGTSPRWFNTYAAILLFMFQMAISLYCTVYVAFTLWTKIKQIKKTQGFIMSKTELERTTANAKIAIVLMFIYIVLLIPSAALLIQNLWNYHTEQIFNVIIDHLRFANCSANALIYALSRKLYKKAYKYILTNPPSQWSKMSYIFREDEIFSSRVTRSVPVLIQVSSDVLKANTKSNVSEETKSAFSSPGSRKTKKNSPKSFSKDDVLRSKDGSTYFSLLGSPARTRRAEDDSTYFSLTESYSMGSFF